MLERAWSGLFSPTWSENVSSGFVASHGAGTLRLWSMARESQMSVADTCREQSPSMWCRCILAKRDERLSNLPLCRDTQSNSPVVSAGLSRRSCNAAKAGNSCQRAIPEAPIRKARMKQCEHHSPGLHRRFEMLQSRRKMTISGACDKVKPYLLSV